MTETKLHLGAFDQILPGWVNSDITPHLLIARIPGLPRLMARLGIMPDYRLAQHQAGIFCQLRYLNVTKRFPFRDGCVSCIYSSQMLEHLRKEDAMRCLTECYRVLKVGGLLRIHVPDLDGMIAQYNAEDPDAWLHEFFALYSKGDKNRHWWHYNELSLRQRLTSIGFKECYRSAVGAGRCKDVEPFEIRRAFGERVPVLIIEAVK
ncbi:MAG: methyltransferase domain-containing protein [Bryobacteraceae bacterium]